MSAPSHEARGTRRGNARSRGRARARVRPEPTRHSLATSSFLGSTMPVCAAISSCASRRSFAVTGLRDGGGQAPPAHVGVPVLRTAGRCATRREREPPSDAEIERGLRERAVSDPRAAEILLRWRQRPGQVSDGDQLQGLTEEQLEGLYATLLRLSALSAEEQSTVLQALLDGRV